MSKQIIERKPNLTVGERFKDARILYNKNGKQTTTAVEKATGIAKSSLSEIENDSRIPGGGIVVQLAKHYGVSSDYLLGLSPNPTTNKDLDAICNYTGLSQNSIQCLHNEKEWGLGGDAIAVIDALLSDYRYHNIDTINRRSYRPILNLLNYFFKYSNSGMNKQVYTNGMITDHGSNGFISSNAIELNDIVIENAVLAEIQLALISLKKNIKETEEK